MGNFKNIAYRLSLLFSVSLLSLEKAGAVDCSDIYSNGVQNNHSGGEIKIESGVDINGGGVDLTTNNLDGGSGVCDNSNCNDAGGPFFSSIPSFQNSNDNDGDIDVGDEDSETVGNSNDFRFGEVKVGEEASLTFSSNESTYYFKKSWDVKKEATITLAPGDYWVKEDLVLGEEVNLVVSPAGTVRLFVKKSVTIKKESTINSGGSAGQLLIHALQDIKLEEEVDFNGYLYSKKNITIEKEVTLDGGISANKTIDIKEDATINYAVPSGDFGSFCSTTPASSVDHYNISVTSPTVTCEAGQVVITPHDASHTAVASDNTTITLTTSPGNDGWTKITGNGTLSGNQYTFAGGETSVTLGLIKKDPATLDIDVTDGSATDIDGDAGEDPDITFVDAAFRFYGDGVVDSINHQIAGKSTSQTGEAITLRAIQTDTATGRCEALINNTTASIGFAYQCNDPGSCATPTNGLAINGSQIIDQLSAGYTNVSVSFDGSGVGTLDFNYFDAGEITLLADADLDIEGESADVQGSSNAFIVRPAGFCVEATESDSDCSNPAVLGSCSAFKSAGANFDLRVQAVTWESDGESDSDYCSGSNQLTPNFMTSVGLSHALVAPGGGAAGSLGLSSATISSGGQVTLNNQTLSEIGVFTISAVKNDYLDNSVDIPAAASGNIGRFTPSHLALSAATINETMTAGATDFSYLSQPFGLLLEIQALNGDGNTSQNYIGIFNRFDDAITPGTLDAGSFSFGAVDANDATRNLTARFSQLSFNGVDWDSDPDGNPLTDDRTGTFDLTVHLDRAALERPVTASLGTLFNDGDNVTVLAGDIDLDVDNDSSDDYVTIGNTLLRFGRLYSRDSWGPENTALAVPLQVEYWTGSQWAISSDDSTAIARNQISFNATLLSDSINDPIGGNPVTFTSLTADDVEFVSGEAGMVVAAPGVTGNFNLNVDLTAYSWLQFDWDQDGDYNDADDADLPPINIRFETYRGHDRIIYWRELMQ